jgi:DUF4097 and DUF4098 domain-containing protein YvlB
MGMDTIAMNTGRKHLGTLKVRFALWTLFILGFLLLSVAAGLRADAATATKTANFNASGKIESLSIENLNGNVQVEAGTSFTAVAELTAKASSEAEAQKLLDATTVEFANQGGRLRLETRDPWSREGGSRKSRRESSGWGRVTVKYAITLPAGAELEADLVNGSMTVKGISGALRLTSVNGNIDIDGALGTSELKTVNGNIRGAWAGLHSEGIQAETVNGRVVLRLPANASFDFSANTMNGEISSTFPLPARRETARASDEVRRSQEEIRRELSRVKREAREKSREMKSAASSEEQEAIAEVSAELSEAMAQLSEEMARMGAEIAREVTIEIDRSYQGSVGKGGVPIRCSTLNGRIVLLAEGTTEAQAKSLVGRRRATVAMVPPVPPVAPIAPMAPIPPVAPMSPVGAAPPVPPVPPAPPSWVEGGSLIRGDIQGDFYSSIPSGEIRLGAVSGAVNAVTRAGEIHVKSAGKDATLSTLGGEVAIGDVGGGLKATTRGGDIEAGVVKGSVQLETLGGDVSVKGAGGPATIRTQGGDVVIGGAQGAVRAETAGGSITCQVIVTNLEKESRLSTSGGDVTVTLPANFKGAIEAKVSHVEEGERAILSDFPEVVISSSGGRYTSRVTASGKLGGGGPLLTLVTSSGRVILRKGPAAAK